ncbi:monocarboxylate transporter 12-like [Ptychodera flava]|uniref:monocarboxylate transporter 12-like n=1 Tax=Ptychodera flava TaxID=63121 RepID=UPI003969CED1
MSRLSVRRNYQSSETYNRDMNGADDPDPSQNGKDGGWYAWLVVAASHVCLMFVFGLFQAFGAMFATIQRYYGETSAKTSWIVAIMMFCEFGLGPISGSLCKRIGYRKTVMIGALLSTSGFLLTCLATSIEFLYLTLGFVVGAGYSLIFSPSLGIVPLYVRKKYALANAVSMSGSGTGGFILSPLLQALTAHYGWKGAFIVFSAVNAQMCVCATLFRTPDQRLKQSSHYSRDNTKERPEPPKSNCLSEIFDINVFRDHPKFILVIAVFTLGCSVGFNGLPSHIIPRAEDLGIGDDRSRALFMSMLGTCSTIGRFAPAAVLLRRGTIFTGSRLLGLSSLCLGLTSLFSSLARTYAKQAISVCFQGFFSGAFMSLMTNCTQETVGGDRMTSAISKSTPFIAIGVLTGPVLAGYIYDVTGDYDYSFYFYGTSSVLAGILMLLLDPFVTRCEKNCRTTPKEKDIELDVRYSGLEHVEN